MVWNDEEKHADEARRDDQRIFQALCTERARLARFAALRPSKIDPGTIEHTERLVERYAAKLRADQPCVTRPGEYK